MNIVFAMILSIVIKGVSAIVEIAIQMLITNRFGMNEYGDYTFYVSLIEGAYFFLFSGSVKLNTFYLSTPSASLSIFKRKYALYFVIPLISTIIVVFTIMENPYGILAGLILLIYYYAFDASSVFFSRGKQLPALLGEYLFGRVALLIGLLMVVKLDQVTSGILFLLYGLQFAVMLLWFALNRRKLVKGIAEIDVPIKKLTEYQMSDIANSVISYTPTILQYTISGAFSAGFVGIILIVKRFINFISGPTAKVFLPEFSRLYKNAQLKELERSYLMIIHIQIVFVGTIGTALIGFPSLILNMFSPELLPYSNVFSIVAFSLLFIAGIGPVTGILQMTGNEKVCNRNQWVSIGFMVLTWIILWEEPLFAVYGLCVQAMIEGVLKYYSVCKWFGKNIIPVANYFFLWLPVLLVRIVVEWGGWQYSFIGMLFWVMLVFLWNLAFATQDSMLKEIILKKLKR